MILSILLTEATPYLSWSTDTGWPILGLFCKRALQNRQYSEKETYDFLSTDAVWPRSIGFLSTRQAVGLQPRSKPRATGVGPADPRPYGFWRVFFPIIFPTFSELGRLPPKIKIWDFRFSDQTSPRSEIGHNELYLVKKVGQEKFD